MARSDVPLGSGFGNGDVSFWYREVGMPSRGTALPGGRHVDVCVVGAGYTGLWTAYYLKRAKPDLRIAVCEKEFAGFGASGRNGGWLVGELAGSHRRYAARHGRDATVALQRAMYDSVDEVIAVAAAEGIDADVVRGGMLGVATNAAQRRRLDAELAEARAWGSGEDDLRQLDAGELAQRLRVAGARGAVWSPHGARIQPAKLVRGLVATVRRLGVDVYEHTPVTELRAGTGSRPAAAVTPHGVVTADHVVRATEGFTAALPGERRSWLPMNSSMIVTEPLTAETWDEVGWTGCEVLGDLAHYYMYAQRTADGRIAFGGRGVPYHYGSRWDGSGRTQEGTITSLWRMLTTMFPAAGSSRVAHAWSGVLGVPRDWCSTVCVDHATGLGHAGGYTGHGVATTNLAGRTLRDLVLRRDTELTRLPWVDWRVRRWEPEPLRWLGVHALYALYRAADGRENAARTSGRTSSLARLADVISGR